MVIQEKRTTYHMQLSIRGALMRSDRELEGVFTGEDGKPMSAREARLELMEKLSKGEEYMPIGKCDRFDPKEKGCLGHEQDEGA